SVLPSKLSNSPAWLTSNAPYPVNCFLDYREQRGGDKHEEEKTSNRNDPRAFQLHEVSDNRAYITCRLRTERVGNHLKHLIPDTFGVKINAQQMDEQDNHR